MLTAQRIVDPREWNALIASLPNARPHILQSYEWGAFKAKYGWTPTQVALCDSDSSRAAALILRRPLPRTPFGVLYVPRGPLLAPCNLAQLEETLAFLERFAREQHAIFVKIDPEILADDEEPLHVMQRRGWRPSREQIQFKNTLLLDLAPTREELLAAMKPKTRYNVRLSEKRGVRIEEGTRNDLALFYDMYVETSRRDRFVIRQFSYYRDAWGAFLDAGLAQMFLARVVEETVAGLIVFAFGGRAWYFYGASRAAHRDRMPNHLLQWHAICWAREHGCTSYDFWGAPDALDENAPMYGVYRFKEGFGGKFTRYAGAYDYVVNPALYLAYSVVRPWYLSRLRLRAGYVD